MKSVILNMMIVGAIGGLIGGEASAISFGFNKSKNKTQQVQQEKSSSVKKVIKKTKDFSANAVKKTKEGLVKTKDSIKASYQNSKEKRREKAHQKGLAEEGKPINTMFVSKSDVEYNLDYLSDVRKSLKSSASSVEKTLSSLGEALEEAFVIKSLLFEISIYIRLCEKFSEQYLEGMNKLKKSKQYDDDNYNRAMDLFENAYKTVRYEATQKSLISHVRGLISEKNLKSVSIKNASTILKKVQKLSENFEQIPESAAKLKEVVTTINEQTVDKESSFGYMEKGMVDHVRSAGNVMKDISDILKEVSKIVQNHIDEIQEQETETR